MGGHTPRPAGLRARGPRGHVGDHECWPEVFCWRSGRLVEQASKVKGKKQAKQNKQGVLSNARRVSSRTRICKGLQKKVSAPVGAQAKAVCPLDLWSRRWPH